MLNEAFNLLNEGSRDLQTTTFRVAKSPEEWHRLRNSRSNRDYDKLLDVVTPFIRALTESTAPERLEIASKLGSDVAGVLRVFADWPDRYFVPVR